MPHYTKDLQTIGGQGYVTSTSRYAGSRLRQYTEENYLTFEIYKRKVRLKKGDEQYVQITPQVEYRPDLVSYEVYGTPDLWWSILEFNDMKDIMEFEAGKNIMLPGSIML